jgi:transposase
LAQEASVESETFWMARVIGQIEYKPAIEREIRRAKLSSEEAEGLARISLANYFAGALMMLALALVLDGRPPSEAAAFNGMDRQTLRDWVHRYNEAGIEGLKSRKSSGREPYLTAAQMASSRAGDQRTRPGEGYAATRANSAYLMTFSFTEKHRERQLRNRMRRK